MSEKKKFEDGHGGGETLSPEKLGLKPPAASEVRKEFRKIIDGGGLPPQNKNAKKPANPSVELQTMAQNLREEVRRAFEDPLKAFHDRLRDSDKNKEEEKLKPGESK